MEFIKLVISAESSNPSLVGDLYSVIYSKNNINKIIGTTIKKFLPAIYIFKE
jgi:hypothetical protein